VGSGTTLLLIDWRGKDEHSLPCDLWLKDISTYALTHTTLTAFPPTNLRLFLDPEVMEELGPRIEAGRIAKKLARVSGPLVLLEKVREKGSTTTLGSSLTCSEWATSRTQARS